LELARTKEWRESHGLTQRELAAEAGVGEATVARIETGASVAPPTARKIAEALGVAVADLLERPPVPLAEAPDQGHTALTAQEWAKEAGAEYHGMDDDSWDAFVRDIDAREEVSKVFHQMAEDAKTLHALLASHRMQYPRAREQRQELNRGLRELKARRYSNLAGQAALLHARDLVDEIFEAVREEANA
jgi:transcriptional regulator with XRE-family HTH domain